MAEPSIWTCTVVHRGIDRETLPSGSDAPMRKAVEAAFRDLTGVEPEGVSSGWGRRHIGEAEEAVLDRRPPADGYYECWQQAHEVVERLGVPRGEDFTATRDRYLDAVRALTEALFAAGVPADAVVIPRSAIPDDEEPF